MLSICSWLSPTLGMRLERLVQELCKDVSDLNNNLDVAKQEECNSYFSLNKMNIDFYMFTLIMYH